ncbi:MAG: hypothetical protein FJX73_04430 [Armatimonadetes bacterium]|nr:hypothetical protein [Armatimonadota bacterium]
MNRPVPPGDNPTADPMALFIERAEQVGMSVITVGTYDEAVERAVALCRERRVQRAALWDTPEMDPIRDRLLAEGVEVLDPRGSFETLAGAEIGITRAEWGVAETGSLVISTGPGKPQAASLLAPLHLAVLRSDRIVPELATLLERSDPLPSALVLITGPSRSADIGLVPVLGAHGPMEVAVLVVMASQGR